MRYLLPTTKWMQGAPTPYSAPLTVVPSGPGAPVCISLYLPISPYISLIGTGRPGLYLPMSPYIYLHLHISPCISLYLPRRDRAPRWVLTLTLTLTLPLTLPLPLPYP